MIKLSLIECPCADASLCLTLASLHALCFAGESWSSAQLSGSLALETTRLVIARQANQIVGFLLAQQDVEALEILTFCVHPDKRAQGIGGKLLKAALRLAPDGGAFLEVAADNAAAQSLYRQAGFDLIGTRKNYYKRAEGAVDAYCFKWFGLKAG